MSTALCSTSATADLCHGDLFACAGALIQGPRGLHRQQAADLDIHRRIAQHQLHAFTLGQFGAKASTVFDILTRNLQRAFRQAQSSACNGSAVPWPANLHALHALTHTHQAVLVWDLQPIEFHLAMAPMLLGPHDRNAANDLPARLIFVEQKSRQIAACIIRCARQQNEMLGHACPGDEPFVAVDHPLCRPFSRRGSASCRRGRSPRPVRVRSSQWKTGPCRR